MKRLLVFAMMIASLATMVVGSAASFGVGADDLGAGSALVNECDNSFVHSFTTSGGNVTQVIVDDIAATCVGGRLSLTLTNSSGSGIGSGGPVAVGGTSASVSISPQPFATEVGGIHIVVVGP